MQTIVYLIIAVVGLPVTCSILRRLRRERWEREFVKLSLKPGAGIKIEDNRRLEELLKKLR